MAQGDVSQLDSLSGKYTVTRIIKHEFKNAFTGQMDGCSAVEYRLPVKRSELKRLPQSRSIEALCDLGPSEDQSWFSRFYESSNNGIHAVFDVVRKFEPVSLVHAVDQWYVRCCRDNCNDYLVGKELYLANKRNWTTISFEIEDFPACKTFKEFLRKFAGLRESMPQTSGSFMYDEFQLFGDLATGLSTDEYEDWLDAMCVYYARNGDLVLLGEDGETGWYVLGENRVELLTSNFDELLELWAAFRSETNEPFDSFSVAEYLRNK